MPGVKGQRSGGHNARTRKQHELAGTFRKNRHGSHTNPDPPKGIPTPPKELEGDAAEEWARMIARLSTTGALSTVDDGVLYQHCRLFAQTERLENRQAEIAASIDILEENLHGIERTELVACFQEIGKLRQLEASNETKIRQNRMALRAYYVEFGLTPASRGRVKLPEKPPETDPFDEFDAPTKH